LRNCNSIVSGDLRVDTRGLQYTGLTAADQVTGNSRQMTTQIAATMRSRSAQLLSGREGSDLIARQTGAS